jgi:hypothetical protein
MSDDTGHAVNLSHERLNRCDNIHCYTFQIQESTLSPSNYRKQLQSLLQYRCPVSTDYTHNMDIGAVSPKRKNL